MRLPCRTHGADRTEDPAALAPSAALSNHAEPIHPRRGAEQPDPRHRPLATPLWAISSAGPGSAGFPAGLLGAPAFQPASPDAGSMPASGDLASKATWQAHSRMFSSDGFGWGLKGFRNFPRLWHGVEPCQRRAGWKAAGKKTGAEHLFQGKTEGKTGRGKQGGKQGQTRGENRDRPRFSARLGSVLCCYCL
jgi:hypothetical protein